MKSQVFQNYQELQDVKTLVIGSGISGVGAVSLLSRFGADIIFYDSNEKLTADELQEKLDKAFAKEADRPANVHPVYCLTGELPAGVEEQVEAAVLSPGVPIDIPLVNRLRDRQVPILGEIELAFLAEKGRVIGITGTNGKTTTTTLMGEIMKAHLGEEKVFVVGNIGNPYTLEVMKTKEDTVTVAEISSFQLETVHQFKPVVSAILNVTPDHLNRHHTMEVYAAAKEAITCNQGKDNICVLNAENSYT
ncbi:MAG: UDP-N-acetylmuramoyl-L-alanine--D-glutamate ligase, partial [Lachnospiraceae bacterium]|nr:UDP-N-acetylmuramoyl-L-alanine--D-glutamate ligase [Lachnospiraceae bacterium]